MPSIEEDGNAVLHNKMVTTTGTDATEVNEVLTVELTASDDGVCVTEVFYTAQPSTNKRFHTFFTFYLVLLL